MLLKKTYIYDTLLDMENVLEYINENKLIAKGQKIGIAVSGGSDSIALLHFLWENKKQLDCEIMAININHKLRTNSDKDSAFVAKFCKENGISLARHTVWVAEYAKENNMNIENAARILRYECFEKTAKKEGLASVALAHHASDQAETVLLHIFRGSGISGARGMEAKRGIYIRPLLNTEKTDITKYIYTNQLKFVTDETNYDNTFARNFIRNQVIPLIQTEWRSVERNIVAFSQSCKEDDEYISNNLNVASLICEGDLVRVPLNYFSYSPAIATRVVFVAIDKLKAKTNFERKHIISIMSLVGMENGKKIDLPNNVIAIKEYEYITLMKRMPQTQKKQWAFKVGKLTVPNYGEILITKTISFKRKEGVQVLDAEKISRKAIWRTMQDGDVFQKAGGAGSKKLSAYLIDKKVPARVRANLPVLALGHEILAVAGLDIGEKVKIDDTTINAYIIEYVVE